MGSFSSKAKKQTKLGIIQAQAKTILEQHQLISDLQSKEGFVEPESIPACDYLVLSGGGIKGIASCGALIALEEAGELKFPMKGYAGSSIGALIASLLAVGYLPHELIAAILELDTSKLIDSSNIVNEGLNIISHFGVARGDYLKTTVDEMLKAKTQKEKYTFQDLYNDSKITLVITTTDLISRSTIYLSRFTYPDLAICDAVLMSVCIPFVFEAVKFNGMLCVDGGLLDNYPIHVFDTPEPAKKTTGVPPNYEVVGLNIMCTSEPSPVNNIFDFGLAFVESGFKEYEMLVLSPENELRTIPIYTHVPTGHGFNVSGVQKQALIETGKLVVKTILENVSGPAMSMIVAEAPTIIEEVSKVIL